MASHAHAQTRSHNSHADGTLTAVKSELSDLNDTIHSSARDVMDHGKRTVQVAGSAARQAASRLGGSAIDARDRIGQTIAERPFASVAVAAAAGAMAMGVLMMWRRR